MTAVAFGLVIDGCNALGCDITTVFAMFRSVSALEEKMALAGFETDGRSEPFMLWSRGDAGVRR